MNRLSMALAWPQLNLGTIVCAVFLSLLSSDLPKAQGCSCALTHPQNHFCRADFVIKVLIHDQETLHVGLSDADIESDTRFNEVGLDQDWSRNIGRTVTRYRMKIKKTYKETELFRNTTKQFLYTPASDAACGVSLINHRKYLIMGRVLDGMPDIMTCGYHKPWSEVSTRIKKDLTKNYQENCHCSVGTCYHPNCMQEKRIRSDDKCMWSPRQDRDRCYLKHSACKSRPTASGKKHRCKWTKTKYLDDCLANAKKLRWY